MRQIILKVALIAAGLSVGLLLSEMVVRAFNLAPEAVYIEKWRMRLSANPKIGYEPIPYLNSIDGPVGLYGYRGLSNDLGFRDRIHAKEKTQQTTRILVLGDSIAAGIWIDNDEDVYPAILESRFRQSGAQVEVLNFGVSGYNTQQEVETLIDKGLDYAPDIVILTYCLNDRYEDNGDIIYHLNQAENQHSALNFASLTPLSRFSELARLVQYGQWFTPHEIDRQQQRTQIYSSDRPEKYLAILGELQKRFNFKAVVVLFPHFDFLDGYADRYEYFDQHTQIKALSVDNGLHFFDLYDTMMHCKRSAGDTPISFDRFHPRPAANYCAANAIKDFLEKHSLVTPKSTQSG